MELRRLRYFVGVAESGAALLLEPLPSLPHPGLVFRPMRGAVVGDLHVAWRPAPDRPLRDAFLEELP